MPLCQLHTNLPRAKVDAAFVKELSKFVGGVMDSTEKMVTLQINPDLIMIRSGSMDPVVHLGIYSPNLKTFTDTMKAKWMESLTPFLSEKLGISDLFRIIISFHPMEASHVGFSGKLASDM